MADRMSGLDVLRRERIEGRSGSVESSRVEWSRGASQERSLVLVLEDELTLTRLGIQEMMNGTPPNNNGKCSSSLRT